MKCFRRSLSISESMVAPCAGAGIEILALLPDEGATEGRPLRGGGD